ncbi:unnamed protein product [Cyprideis torosa]|uniref:Uncharacterized protein n=1 Tax=Cyprideis torosa TaxID=163714 RepID=A0A7R8ZK27_9CRUS|nr:unnamed protein product [Cyprideis torosa]CAG0889877.1 unnamed protein product [Cyprideis torosa]
MGFSWRSIPPLIGAKNTTHHRSVSATPTPTHGGNSDDVLFMDDTAVSSMAGYDFNSDRLFILHTYGFTCLFFVLSFFTIFSVLSISLV